MLHSGRCEGNPDRLLAVIEYIFQRIQACSPGGFDRHLAAHPQAAALSQCSCRATGCVASPASKYAASVVVSSRMRSPTGNARSRATRLTARSGSRSPRGVLVSQEGLDLLGGAEDAR